MDKDTHHLIDASRRRAMAAGGLAAGAWFFGTRMAMAQQANVQFPKPRYPTDTLPQRVPVQTNAPAQIDVVFTTDAHQWFFGGKQDGRVPTNHPLLGPNGNIKLFPRIPPAYLLHERYWELVWADGIRGPQSFPKSIKVTTGSKSDETRQISESLSASAGYSGGGFNAQLSVSLSTMTRTTIALSAEREEMEQFTISAGQGEAVHYAMWQLVDVLKIVDSNGQPIAHNGIWKAFKPGTSFPTDEGGVRFYSPPPLVSRGQRFVDRTLFAA